MFLVQDKDMVKLLLEFKSKLDTCLAKAFQSNPIFSNAQKEAFEHFINQVNLTGITATAIAGSIQCAALFAWTLLWCHASARIHEPTAGAEELHKTTTQSSLGSPHAGCAEVQQAG